MKQIPKPFRYFTEKETRAPGYLRRRFAQIRKEQKEAAEAQAKKVTPLKKAGAK